jgi:hypothetical protein
MAVAESKPNSDSIFPYSSRRKHGRVWTWLKAKGMTKVGEIEKGVQLSNGIPQLGHRKASTSPFNLIVIGHIFCFQQLLILIDESSSGLY